MAPVAAPNSNATSWRLGARRIRPESTKPLLTCCRCSQKAASLPLSTRLRRGSVPRRAQLPLHVRDNWRQRLPLNLPKGRVRDDTADGDAKDESKSDGRPTNALRAVASDRLIQKVGIRIILRRLHRLWLPRHQKRRSSVPDDSKSAQYVSCNYSALTGLAGSIAC